MTFPNFESLKDAVTKQCVANNRFFRNEYKKAGSWACRCWYYNKSPPCFWRVQAQGLKSGVWKIKQLRDVHTCHPDYSHGGDDLNIDYFSIARFIVGKVRVDPEYKVKLIQHDVLQEFHVPVSYKKCWLARIRATELLYGSWENSYSQLPIMLYNLQNSYPGTVVDVVYASEPPNLNVTPEETTHFKYAFWAFAAAIHGLQYCMPVVTVDGTHLYGKYKGHLLLAVAMNGNREIFPLAYAVVDGETCESWDWFFRLLVHRVIGSQQVCIISDRHIGIINSYRDLPELRTGLIMKHFCLRHVRSNFMTKFRNSDLKNLVWATGSTHNIQQFEGYMAEIRNMSEEGYQYLNDIPRAAWTLCFDGGFRCGILTTNSSESFNNMLKGCRMLPVTAILSMSYAKMVELFAKRYKLGIQWQEQSMHITPKVKNFLLNREKTKHKWTVSSYGNNQYVVTHTSRTDPSSIYNYLVNLFNSVCTCGQWTSDNIPCVHVHAVYHSFRQQVPHNILPARYSVQNYLSYYSGIIQPVLFPQNLDVGNFKVLPPKRPTDEIPRSGRRQRNRYQGEMDFRARR
ncbi:hypothetical protein DM860_009205 [Cuscuta australis]|uniref:SWIM-type domain-containing protein n=1 Tax=Cuscuta australis TaxID=267555 RepID=A0A328DDV3_9ASTE|nr:hypothetical protein DM860_009205 [Cuscuta australis]